VSAQTLDIRSPDVAIFGPGADHPRGPELARATGALLGRYVDEVVMAWGLCPFLHNKTTGLGAVGVVLEATPSVEVSVAAVRALGSNVLHLCFPLSELTSSPFERFGNKLAEEVRRGPGERLVHATFHPELVGGRENAYRLIGLLRQAPVAFIQFVPQGLMKGGTVLAGEEPAEGHAEARFTRLGSRDVDAIVTRLSELKEETLALSELTAEIRASLRS
jgi:hypothetical protein